MQVSRARHAPALQRLRLYLEQHQPALKVQQERLQLRQGRLSAQGSRQSCQDNLQVAAPLAPGVVEQL
jgi:hypothetical protein